MNPGRSTDTENRHCRERERIDSACANYKQPYDKVQYSSLFTLKIATYITRIKKIMKSKTNAQLGLILLTIDIIYKIQNYKVQLPLLGDITEGDFI